MKDKPFKSICQRILELELVYVTNTYVVWVAVVFVINCASNTGCKPGHCQNYCCFACIMREFSSKCYSKPYCYKLMQHALPEHASTTKEIWSCA